MRPWAVLLIVIGGMVGCAGALAGRDEVFFGVDLKPFDKGGVQISRVVSGSPADQLGLKIGYVIVGIGSVAVRTYEEAAAAVARIPVGEWDTIDYVAEGKLYSQMITVADRDEWKRSGRFVLPPRGMLGIGIADTPEKLGVEITHVAPGSVAARHGLVRGDLILDVDGVVATDTDVLMREVGSRYGERTPFLVGKRGWVRRYVMTPAAVDQRHALTPAPLPATASLADGSGAQQNEFWCKRSAVNAAICVGLGLAALEVLKSLGGGDANPDRGGSAGRDEDNVQIRPPAAEDPVDGSVRRREALE